MQDSARGCLLVLLPGLEGTSILLEPLIGKLKLEAQAVEYPAILPTDYADLLPFVMNSLPSQRDFVLLGWSFSGPLALMAAAQNPPGLRGVVLAATFVQRPIPWVPRMAGFLARSPLFYASGWAARTMARLGRYGSRELLDRITRAHNAIPPGVMAARIRQVLLVDARPELQNCRVPVLYLGASKDRIVPRSNCDTMAVLKPEMRVRFLEGPHIAMAIRPAEAAIELEEFVKFALQSQPPAKVGGPL